MVMLLIMQRCLTKILFYSQKHLSGRGQLPFRFCNCAEAFHVISFLMSVFWEQSGMQITSHRIRLSRSAFATKPALYRHLSTELRHHNGLHILNLLSEKGDEKLLRDSYHEQVKESPWSNTIRWTDIDFHKEMASEFGLDNIRNLIWKSKLGKSIEDWGAWSIMTDGTVADQQEGIVRTNCIDWYFLLLILVWTGKILSISYVN